MFGDESKSALSYRKFRKKLESCSVIDNVPVLSEKIKEYLKEANSMRNWGAHIPESLLTAEFEADNELGLTDTKDLILENKDQINIEIYHSLEKKWLITLYDQNEELYEMFNDLFHQMRKDYNFVTTIQVDILIKYPSMIRPHYNKPVFISYEIQQKKYRQQPHT